MGVTVVSFHPDRTGTTVGIALGVAAAVCWSLGTITAKRLRPRVEPLWAVALPLVVGGALLSLVAAATGETSVDWSGRVAVALVWTTLVGTTLAWLLWMFLVTSGDVGRVAVSIFLVPVVAVALSWWLLDETVGWSLVIGTLVCAGVLLVNVTTTPQAGTGTGAGTSDEDPVATGRQR